MNYEENKDIDYVSKWLRIPIKSLFYVWTDTINGLIIEARMFKLKISKQSKEYKALRD